MESPSHGSFAGNPFWGADANCKEDTHFFRQTHFDHGSGSFQEFLDEDDDIEERQIVPKRFNSLLVARTTTHTH